MITYLQLLLLGYFYGKNGNFIGESPMVSSVQFSHSVMSNSATPWTVALQAPLPVGFPRQEYSSGLSFRLQGLFLTLMSPAASALQADSLLLSHWGSPVGCYC